MYALCVTVTVNTQGFVWKFFCMHHIYNINIQSFIHSCARRHKTEKGPLTTTASLRWLNLFDCGLTQHSYTLELLHKHNAYVEDMDPDNRQILTRMRGCNGEAYIQLTALIVLNWTGSKCIASNLDWHKYFVSCILHTLPSQGNEGHVAQGKQSHHAHFMSQLTATYH